MIVCPTCAEDLVDQAPSCSSCGTPVPSWVPRPAPAVHVAPMARPNQRRWRPADMILLLLVPSAGQISKGYILSGAAWFLAVYVGYLCLIVPGIVLHVLCVRSGMTLRPRQGFH